ncbi:hypothetical protein BH11PSE5_BH11PSE5_32590 [soil metagenome]|uniref:cobalamin B12-binding domain-containing protein n=1 Tax=Sphingobium sp. BS19 TaxID=3018973 RepID=UPI0022EDBAAC|nr:cobalamin B12-binding domain-containing protein [Sphingobium sp. BS19]GLI97409.1 hypothetical protein Sbs19_12270 [Sphingobium sp. BS19]
MSSMLGLARSSQPANRGDFQRRIDSAQSLPAFQVRLGHDHDFSITKLIEGEIIPRLLVAHATDAPPLVPVDGMDTITQDEVEAFAPLSLRVEAADLLDRVEAILARGVSVETLMVDLLAPTARLLGEYWKRDECDFVEVTMGLWRLQEIVHEISARTPAARQCAAGGRRALIASMPGDKHSFGALLLDEMFIRDSWITDRLSEVTTAELLGRVSEEWFDFVGLTIGYDYHIGALPTTIKGLRSVSRNPRLCIMVGGPTFVNNPDLAAQVGADGTAPDAKLAVKLAGKLVATHEREATY